MKKQKLAFLLLLLTLCTTDLALATGQATTTESDNILSPVLYYNPEAGNANVRCRLDDTQQEQIATSLKRLTQDHRTSSLEPLVIFEVATSNSYKSLETALAETLGNVTISIVCGTTITATIYGGQQFQKFIKPKELQDAVNRNELFLQEHPDQLAFNLLSKLLDEIENRAKIFSDQKTFQENLPRTDYSDIINVLQAALITSVLLFLILGLAQNRE